MIKLHDKGAFLENGRIAQSSAIPAKEAAKKIIEPSEKIKEKIRNIFKPKPIFVRSSED